MHCAYRIRSDGFSARPRSSHVGMYVYLVEKALDIQATLELQVTFQYLHITTDTHAYPTGPPEFNWCLQRHSSCERFLKICCCCRRRGYRITKARCLNRSTVTAPPTGESAECDFVEERLRERRVVDQELCGCRVYQHWVDAIYSDLATPSTCQSERRTH